MIEKEIKANVRLGTKAQQALADEREATKAKGVLRSRERREERRRDRFAKKTQKRRGR